MHLRSIHLRQFRNHHQLELAVQPGVNLFIGPNAAGKTNLIEAIAVLATGVSPRGADAENMVQWGEEGFSIKGQFGYEDSVVEPLTLEMKYHIGSTRTIRQNDQTAVRLKDLIGRVPIVSFVPEDLSLVKGEPELRRRAMNMILMQVDPSYTEVFRRYTEALKSRNAALRQLAAGQITRSALEPWDAAVIHFGLVVSQKRADLIEEFSSRVSFVQQRVSGGRETLALEYKPSFAGPWDEAEASRWRDAFRVAEAHDLALGSTSIGPHRDDILFILNDRPAKSFASEGQKRTCAVAFKLAEIPYIHQKLGQKPICLLDDVLSELDAERAEHLLNELSRTGQCFVTLTGLESWPQQVRLPASIYRVSETGIVPDARLVDALEVRSTEGLSDISLTANDITETFSTPN